MRRRYRFLTQPRRQRPIRRGLRLEGLEDRTVPTGLVGHVWQDANANGIEDPGELGARGSVVQLLNAGSDGIIGTSDDVNFGYRVTPADGSYSFASVTPKPDLLSSVVVPWRSASSTACSACACKVRGDS